MVLYINSTIFQIWKQIPHEHKNPHKLIIRTYAMFSKGIFQFKFTYRYFSATEQVYKILVQFKQNPTNSRTFLLGFGSILHLFPANS